MRSRGRAPSGSEGDELLRRLLDPLGGGLGVDLRADRFDLLGGQLGLLGLDHDDHGLGGLEQVDDLAGLLLAGDLRPVEVDLHDGRDGDHEVLDELGLLLGDLRDADLLTPALAVVHEGRVDTRSLADAAGAGLVVIHDSPFMAHIQVLHAA